MADVLAALSVATDLGRAEPIEHMQRSAAVALKLGERLGLELAQLQALHDVALLTYVGCQVYGDDGAKWFGDDIAFQAEATKLDFAGLPAMSLMLRRAGSGGSLAHRALTAMALMAGGSRRVVEHMANHCAAAGELANRLGLGPEVRDGLLQTYARWDGKGVPSDLRGDDLSLPARISHVAELAEAVNHVAGPAAAAEAVEARRERPSTPRSSTRWSLSPKRC